MFIAMNRFQVAPDRAEEFERIWRERESYLDGVEGFVAFALLRGDEPGDYVSHSTWASRDAFLAWARSQAFRQAHGEAMPDGIVVGHPRASLYETVLEQTGIVTMTD